MKKKPIAPTLKALPKGAKVDYPRYRASSVYAAVTTIHLNTNIQLKTKVDRDNGIISVMRVK